ncbi:hypothetical protein HaLaN_19719, partial [Haematococcus lacustris]
MTHAYALVPCESSWHSSMFPNAAALGALGVHGSDQLVLDLGDSAPRLACYSESEPVNYLQELLGCQSFPLCGAPCHSGYPTLGEVQHAQHVLRRRQ